MKYRCIKYVEIDGDDFYYEEGEIIDQIEYNLLTKEQKNCFIEDILDFEEEDW